MEDEIPEGLHVQTIRAYEKDEIKMRLCVIKHLSSKYAQTVIHKRTFLEMWQALETHMMGESDERIHDLKLQFKKLKYKRNMKKYIAKLTLLLDEFKSLNSTWSPADVFDEISLSFPPEYDQTLVTFQRELRRNPNDFEIFKVLQDDVHDVSRLVEKRFNTNKKSGKSKHVREKFKENESKRKTKKNFKQLRKKNKNWEEEECRSTCCRKYKMQKVWND